MTSEKLSKRIRKERQVTARQIEEIAYRTVQRMLELPFKQRWRLALRVLIGKREK